MQILKTEGIIVGETNYSESSKILKVLTPELGLISVISKGCRNLKSKLRGVSSKLIYGDFHIYYKENGISTLISVDIKNTLRNTLSNIDKISYVSYVLDLAHQVYKQSNDYQIYDLLISVILKIEEGYDLEGMTCIFELKLLNYLGIKPNIDGCGICGNDKSIITISTSHGGYVCKNCYSSGKIYNAKTIQLIRMFYYVDIAKLTKLEIKKEIKKELDEFITDYYDQYSGLYLKSRTFLNNLNKIG